MDTTELAFDTSGRRWVDITDGVEDFARGRGDGLLHVFVPHATAGIALIETGASSEGDLLDAVERLLPRDDRYAHQHGSPGHGADHVLPAFIAPSVVLPVIAGQVAFGTWQRVVLVDTNVDNPHRRVRLSFLQG